MGLGEVSAGAFQLGGRQVSLGNRSLKLHEWLEEGWLRPKEEACRLE